MDIEKLNSLKIELDPTTQTGIAIALVLIMLGIALGLKVSHFRFLKERPGLFAGGVFAQLIGLPLATLLLIKFANPPASIALGMIIVACCPGGASSNMFSHFARANIAFSVALTATASLAAAIATPLSIVFWSRLHEPTSTLLDTIGFDAVGFLIQTSILLALPLTVGMLTAHRFPDFAEKYRKRIALIGAIILATTALYGSWQFVRDLAAIVPMIAPIIIAHNAIAFGLGSGAGRLLGADGPTRRALAIEVGIQNSGLALVILLSQLQGLGGAAVVAAAWGIWHLVAGSAIVTLFRQLDRK